jgi:hypothetical protein
MATKKRATAKSTAKSKPASRPIRIAVTLPKRPSLPAAQRQALAQRLRADLIATLNPHPSTKVEVVLSQVVDDWCADDN